MRYLFLTMILLGAVSTSFAMERGGNRGGMQHRDMQRQDINRHHDNNWQHRDYQGNINVNPQVIIPQGPVYGNQDPFPDDTEENQIYEENLQN